MNFNRERLKRTLLKYFHKLDADLFLFGSQAQGTARKNSDFDIGYFCDRPLDSLQLANLQDELEDLPIPPVDLIDFSKVDKDFKNFALRHVKIWKKKGKHSLFESKN